MHLCHLLHVVHESKKARVDQVPEKDHPLWCWCQVYALDPSVESNLLSNVGKPWSINPSLVFTNLYYTLSLMRC
jgi:hypothetical protein